MDRPANGLTTAAWTARPDRPPAPAPTDRPARGSGRKGKAIAVVALAVLGAGFATWQVKGASARGQEAASVTTSPISAAADATPTTVALTWDQKTCRSWHELRRTLAEGKVTPMAGVTKWGATAVRADLSPALAVPVRKLGTAVAHQDLAALAAAAEELDAVCA